MTRDPGTFAASKATVEELAATSFADHELIKRRAFLWKCARPNSWMYGFFVVAAPGALIVYGDLGEAVFRMNAGSEDAVIEWIKRAADDQSYLLSKLSNRQAYRSLYAGEAVAFAKTTENQDLIDDVVLAAEQDSMWAEKFYEICQEHGVYDMPSCEDWAASALWISHALKTFVRLLPND